MIKCQWLIVTRLNVIKRCKWLTVCTSNYLVNKRQWLIVAWWNDARWKVTKLSREGAHINLNGYPVKGGSFMVEKVKTSLQYWINKSMNNANGCYKNYWLTNKFHLSFWPFSDFISCWLVVFRKFVWRFCFPVLKKSTPYENISYLILFGKTFAKCLS